MRTFATPFEKRALARVNTSKQKFIEKTVNCTRSKYREYNKIYREALISLWNYKCQDKLKIYKIYNEEFDPGSG